VLFSFNLLISPFLDYKQLEGNSPGVCKAQGVVFQFLAASILVYFVFIGFVTDLVVVRRFSTRKVLSIEVRFHAICWPFCLAITFLPIAIHGLDVYGPNSGISAFYLQTQSDQVGWFYGAMSLSIICAAVLSTRILARFLALAQSDEKFSSEGGESTQLGSSLIKCCLVLRACCGEVIDFDAPDEDDFQTDKQGLVREVTDYRELSDDDSQRHATTGEMSASDMVQEKDARAEEVNDGRDISVGRLSGTDDTDRELWPSSQGTPAGGAECLHRVESGRSRRGSLTNDLGKAVASPLGTAMRYHMLRHLLFVLAFCAVFTCLILDQINRYIGTVRFVN
jgi:hypothetical protein